jgi:hypothetical protein
MAKSAPKIWTEAETTTAISKWEKSGKNWQETGQKILEQALLAWKKSGNVQPMLKHANQIESMDVKAMRKNSMRAWFETECKFVYDTDTKLFNHGGNTKFTGEVSRVGKWYEAKAEEAYTPVDELKMLDNLVKRLKKRIADGPKDQDNVHMDTVSQIEQVMAEARKRREEEAKAIADTPVAAS